MLEPLPHTLTRIKVHDLVLSLKNLLKWVLKAGHPWTTQNHEALAITEQIINAGEHWSSGEDSSMHHHAVPMHHGSIEYTDVSEKNESVRSFQEASQTDKALYFTDKPYFISRYTKPVSLSSQWQVLPAWLEVSKCIFQVLLLLSSHSMFKRRSVVRHNILYSYCHSQPHCFPHIHCAPVLLQSLKDFPGFEDPKPVLFFTSLD